MSRLGPLSAQQKSRLKFDVNDHIRMKDGGKADDYKTYLDNQAKKQGNGFEFASPAPGWFPTGEQNEGPFEMTPDLAQVRIVHSVGMVMDGGGMACAEILWPNIVNSLASKELQEKLRQLSALQTLPASVKIAAASVGDNVAYRDMCHVKVYDGSPGAGADGKQGKLMNTQHLYKQSDGKSMPVGYPLHLLTEEGGFVLEEPPQLTDTFKHYWYISNSMLTSCAYKQESSSGTFVSIPKNSDAARLMYYVLVVKNGAGAATNSENVTGMNGESFVQSFNDANDIQSWRFPEHTFNDVTELLQSKLNDVRDKSFNCTSIRVEVSPFDIFREHIFAGKGKTPVLITLEIDLHLPLQREGVDTELGSFAKTLAKNGDGKSAGRKNVRNVKGRLFGSDENDDFPEED